MPTIDEHARKAARGLREHVAATTDTPAALHAVDQAGAALGARRTTPRWLPLAAGIAVLAATVGVLSSRGGEGDDGARAIVEVDNATMRPAGPRDGRESMQLPVTVEPSAGLREGQSVTATGSGFVPNESVGVVQCVREAGPPGAAGVDACDIIKYGEATADDNGDVTGQLAVQRLLTTPFTGTVDCAAEPERCLIAIGAINDYDRSGGMVISFSTEGITPIEPATLAVAPAEGLANGEKVAVTGEGFDAQVPVQLSQCSVEFGTCWDISSYPDMSEATTDATAGEEGEIFSALATDAAGTLSATQPVWRFLPGPDAATYVDCATSACVIRALPQTGLAPTPAAVAFSGAGPLPTPPEITVEMGRLGSGASVRIVASDLPPGTEAYPSLCIVDQRGGEGCLGFEGSKDSFGGVAVAGEDGSIEIEGNLSTANELCLPGSQDCQDLSDLSRCGHEWTCEIQLEVYRSFGTDPGPPVFTPPPVEVRAG